ncbi:MAG: hypothetical protein ACI920_003897, partial [Saprospiraceae bacterium]
SFAHTGFYFFGKSRFWRSTFGNLRVQLIGACENIQLNFCRQNRLNAFQADLTDVAPRANEIGNELDVYSCQNYRISC